MPNSDLTAWLSTESLVHVPSTEGPQLVAALEGNVGDHDVDITTNQRVAEPIPAGRPGGLTDRGEIEVDGRGATSVPGVFAAGDATTVPCQQIVVAMSAGSTAMLSAFDHLIRTAVSAAA